MTPELAAAIQMNDNTEADRLRAFVEEVHKEIGPGFGVEEWREIGVRHRVLNAVPRGAPWRENEVFDYKLAWEPFTSTQESGLQQTASDVKRVTT